MPDRFDALVEYIAALVATPRAGPPGRLGRGAVPDLGGAGGGQDAPGARAGTGHAVAANRGAGGGAVPDDAADTSVGGGRVRARGAASAGRAGTAPAAGLPG